MIRRIAAAFTEHPASVDESYAEHAGFAASFGLVLIVAGCAAMVHALLPFACRTTASDTVLRLHAGLVARRAHAARTEAPAGRQTSRTGMTPAIGGAGR